MPNVSIRYAETDDDIINLHKFLCVVAGANLPGKIDAKDSIEGVWECATNHVALMAMRDGWLIGTVGLVCVPSWWNHKVKYLANRWAFALPDAGVWRPMLKEAKAIGVSSNMEVHIISEARGTVTILNRNPLRDRPSILTAKPEVQTALAKSPKSSTALTM